jgi:hypothetical protein
VLRIPVPESAGHVTVRCRDSRSEGLGPIARWARAKASLTRDVGCDEIRPPDVRGIALWRAASHADRSPTTRDARHSEGNYRSYIDDLKKREGADADRPHRVAFRKLVRA